MKNNRVEMGVYYNSKEFGLVRTVCQAIDLNSKKVMIAFVKVGEGGCASEMYLLPRNEFMDMLA